MYKRVFLIVLDSLGIGEADDAEKYGDIGSNTLLNVLRAKKRVNLKTFKKLGLLNLATEENYHQKKFTAKITKLNEVSDGKDTLTGHYEMMGLKVDTPSKTFTETGFPKILISELEKSWGRKIIGNISASGTEIIKELGKQHMETGSAIVYTSADSVLQIAAHEEVIPLEELYNMCKIARKITLQTDWKVDRIIARPFIGDEIKGYTRTSNRKDYALSPFNKTFLDNLNEANLDVIAIGKIADIFNNQGISESFKSKNNEDGMNITINIAKTKDFNGLCFTNLVDFDSNYGHRRNPKGYLNSLELVDKKMKSLIKNLSKNDLLLITADHGNDPGFKGSDHTREKVPFIAYYKGMRNGEILDEKPNFACIGATILDNFNVKKYTYQIGESILKEINGSE